MPPSLRSRAQTAASLIDASLDDCGFVRAPGRVNLIGEHTDYQDGFCLPMAIDLDVIVAWRTHPDDDVVVASSAHTDRATFDRSVPPSTLEPAWARPAAGMAAELADDHDIRVGVELGVDSTVPIGAGLSSSAAFEVAVGLALATAAGSALTGDALALAAQRAEHRSTGMPCGVMDQMASVHGQAGHALLLDCRTLGVAPVRIPDDLAVVVVHCGIPRTLVGTEYAERRAGVEAAAARLGVPTLRDAQPEAVANDPLARHVVSENRRTLMFVAALRRGRVDELGPLMLASHASLRDDYEVSTPALDVLVDSLMEAGAIGARLTGAGFGGCVVALTPASRAEQIADVACDHYRSRTNQVPTPFVVAAADGARRLDPTIESGDR